MSEHVQTCLNLFRINMIRIDTILKHVKTRNENMTKYTKIEQMAQRSALKTTKLLLGPLRQASGQKPGQIAVVMHYCDLSRFFFGSDLRFVAKKN